jgi:hypothetical protein
MMRLRIHLLLTALAVAAVGNMPAHAADNDALMKNAMSAAPDGVAKNATIMIPDGKGGMTTLKKGTNGFTCMPDDPTTPANDPMCADANSMLWIQAYMAHAQPPDGKVGITYMLQGDSVASNTDPYATTPPAGGKWLTDGPHIMVFNATALLDAYPHAVTATPDSTQPYVMYAGTPYAHLMVPVKPQ